MPNYRAQARRAAQRYGLDPGVFSRQIQQESGFNPSARSPAGALGIAQIMPRTAQGWGVNPLNAKQALDAAAKNMASYVRKYGGYENALRAYNAGPGAIQASRGYAETNNYVKTILGGKNPGRLSAPSASAGPSGPRTPAATHLQFDPNSATGEALDTLIKPRARPPVTAPAPPSFSAAPVMASPIAQAAAQQGEPEDPRANLSAALQKIDRLGQNTGAQPTVTTPASGGGGGGGGGSDVAFRGKPGSGVLELIHNDGGKGYGIKNGKVVDAPSTYSGVWAGHANHVHVAAGPSTVVALGKLAQRMGLHVGENPHFGGVNPVHTGGSYHYKGEAIDVSGDPKRMNAYSRAVEKYNRTRRLPS
jgi:hypothetical protein